MASSNDRSHGSSFLPGLVALLLTLGLSLAGCSLGNISPDACTKDSECAALFGAASRCDNGYCSGDPSCDQSVDGHACFSCPPTAHSEFLNACTDASCVPFDTKRLTKLGPDGKLPPLP